MKYKGEVKARQRVDMIEESLGNFVLTAVRFILQVPFV